MKKFFFSSLICVASVAVIVAFFMPWATVATSVTGLSKGLTGTLSKTPIAGKIIGELSKVTDVIGDIGDISVESTVRGYQIPVLVNDETSKVAISLTQVFFRSIRGLDRKSYLVYFVPVLGVVCALLALSGIVKEKNFLILLMVLLSGAVALGGLYSLYTADLSNLMVRISIQKGLWYTMYSFLFICVVGIIWLVAGRKRS